MCSLNLTLDPRPGKIRTGLRRHPLAELLAQSPRLHLLDRAFGELAELERAERHPDEPVHRQAEVAEHVLHLAVLALADREGEPDVAALGAVDRGLDRSVADAVDGDAVAQPVELILRHPAMGAHAIAAQPAGRRQFERAREPAVVGEQQQPLGVEVEPADADEARQVLGQDSEDGGAAAGIGVRGHQAARLVIEKEPRALARRQRLPVDGDAVRRRHVARRRGDHLAVDRHPPGRDPGLGLAARGEPGAGHDLGDALAVPGMIDLPAHCLFVGLAARVAA